jgi:hypothetical protein
MINKTKRTKINPPCKMCKGGGGHEHKNEGKKKNPLTVIELHHLPSPPPSLIGLLVW